MKKFLLPHMAACRAEACAALYDISRVLVVGLLFLAVFLVASPVFAAEVFYANDRVNIRSGPGTDYDKLKTLPIGAEVDVVEYDGEGWSEVLYDGLEGFIKSEFLSSELPDNAPQISPGGVVMMTWQEAKNVVPIGETIPVYDVYSGLTYNIRSFSNGAHADVEPVTAEDTEIIKRTYGGVWAWDPRPVWVTVGDTTIAASINGMPHGGGVNSTNGMSGQICLHFKDSTVHNGNWSYNSDMQWAVQAAFDAAQ